jgi:IS5 family transposase
MAEELRAISKILDDNPAIQDLVLHDLSDSRRQDVGAPGMTADQVLRCGIIKQTHQFSYEKLAFHLGDSVSFRSFCRLPFGETPGSSSLQANIARIRPSTWEAVNQTVVRWAQERKLEKGRQVRIDSTAVETHIHYPQDSALLKDCVVALTRGMKALGDIVKVRFSDHRRRARRRALAIVNARGMEHKAPLYRDLVRVTRQTAGEARVVIDQLKGNPDPTVMAVVEELKRLLGLTDRVIDQTVRRVFQGETVPAQEKVVSIFEEHSDIIHKKKRETSFGHKVFLTVGKSSLVLDCVTVRGNPADSGQALGLLDRQREIYGRYPRQASLDAGFACRKNLRQAKQGMGIRDVAFAKKCGLKISDMVKSSWVYEKLRRFRAGIEGCISHLKRIFGWDRCHWKGWEHFQQYVQLSVVSYNLLVLARLTL